MKQLNFVKMKELWDELLYELSEFDVELEDALNPPAGDHEISDLETRLNVTLPEDFVDFYRVHNGQDEMADNLIYGQELLSMRRIIAEWKIWKELLDKGKLADKANSDKGVKNEWWNPKWVPFTYDGAGNHYCLDLDPSEDGKVGQVIYLIHDDPKREVIAGSFIDFIKKYIGDLESGKYIID